MNRCARVSFLILSALAGACTGDGTQTSDASTTTQTGGGTTMTSASSDGHSSATPPTSTVTGTTSQGTTEPPAGTTICPMPAECPPEKIDIEVVTPSVMLVLDKSGSMVADPGGYWDHDQDPATPTITRWHSLYSMVDLFVNDFDDSMNFGAVLFPSTAATSIYSEAACVVSATPEVPIGPLNAAAILGSIPGALTDSMLIKGATPTTRGLKVAITELEAAPDDRPKLMILITDGAANCQENAPDDVTLFEVYDDKVTETVASALALGIKTYVVGIGISQVVSSGVQDGNPDNINTYDQLNLVAIAGGVPRPGAEKFFNTSNQDQLQAALQTIVTQELSCIIELPFTPPSPYYLQIQPYGKDQVMDCMTEDGWMYLPKLDPNDPEELVRVELCGQACLDFQMRGKLDIEYRCLPPDPC